MVLRRTGLDGLPLFMVLGLSASLLVWAGWGAEAESHVRAGSRNARAEHELGAALPVDRLAAASERTASRVDALRLKLASLGQNASAAASPELGATEASSGPNAGERLQPVPGAPELRGELRADGLIADGVPQGRWLLYDSNGRPIFSGEFGRGGEPIGLWTWSHPEGQALAEGGFQNGQPDGVWYEWHASGELASQTQFDGGLLAGPASEWYENGAPKQQGGFDEGERVGLWSSWYENGQIRARGAYDRGLRSGLWEEWHSNGQPMLVASYVRGRAHGLWQSWYSNSQVKERGHFVDGRREGVWHFFDFSGGVDLRTGFYRSGRMVRD
jgi:antitoxin component YwqK of YwqJK toxin-antitoxin module